MVLAGFADFDKPAPTIRERPIGEADHVAWSVPPQAAAALVDRASDWTELGAPGAADGPNGA
jgi:hypothetical protein